MSTGCKQTLVCLPSQLFLWILLCKREVLDVVTQWVTAFLADLEP